jgi:hypothetical protein
VRNGFLRVRGAVRINPGGGGAGPN